MRNIPDYDLSTAAWHKSSHSAGANDCLEVADCYPDVTPVRDSKNPHGPKLVFQAAAWCAFIEGLKHSSSPSGA
ncbi:DUF397 domain-containing protein [Streptomyces sp. AN091965]|uniref:DUF397 domain-containing protein n=1 Tax=Streptomyces sp. AN091965 TaxID=2927803 RepID=UPI001F61947F|nr:DUF397 domain-containing protein [Streptomyces sp. AN091965]MCI3931460.1 DUF397 domain-containing protein [Streptomyces sp. AN091965]